MKNIQILILLTGGLLTMMSCKSENNSNSIKKRVETPSSPSYHNDIQPIMERYCTKCHYNKKAAAKLSLANYADVVEETRYQDLLFRINCDTMPMPPKRLMRDSLRTVINNWAELGYPLGIPDTTRSKKSSK